MAGGDARVHLARADPRPDRLDPGAAIKQAVDGRSDVYSLGLVLYRLLGGRVPLPDPAAMPPLHRLNPRVSAGLSDIVARCLAESPARRYASAHALADDLRRHLSHLPLHGVRNRSLRQRCASGGGATPSPCP